MKKTALLHSEISEVVARMGHGDMLVVADAGLPIPIGVRRIDVAVCEGAPGFLETVGAVATELKVERIVLARETGAVSPHVREGLLAIFPGVYVEQVSHEELKGLCVRAMAVVRTGEFTPYANVILVSGVVF